MIRTGLRILLAAFYGFAGYAHIANPDFFLQITPGWVPYPETVIFWTGIAELVGAAALLQPFSSLLRKCGAWALAAYAVCVFPANIHHFAMDMAKEGGGVGLAYHVPRMFAQPLIIWLSLWTGGVTDWPFHRRPPQS